MNKLPATIASVRHEDSLYFLELEAESIRLGMLLFDLKPAFVVGSRVNVLFKESEVALGVDLSGELSFSNRFPARVTAIRRGEILAEITLRCAAGELASIVTMRAVERMGLAEGCAVTAMVKASQISLEAHHDD